MRGGKEDLGIAEGTRVFSADFSVSLGLLTPYVIRTSFVFLLLFHHRCSEKHIVSTQEILPK